MLKEMLVTAPSLESISEVMDASPDPPMMTSWSPRAQALEAYLFTESVTGSLVQPPVCLFQWTQLLWVDESLYPPPHSRWLDWTCIYLLSGSEGS